MTDKTEQTYIPPQMEVVKIEVEQSVLFTASDLGDRHPDMDW